MLASSPATPRFYLAAVEKNRVRDKIWEWPGEEAKRVHVQCACVHVGVRTCVCMCVCVCVSVGSPCMSPLSRLHYTIISTMQST